MSSTPITTLQELSGTRVVKFTFERDGISREGIVLRHKKRVVAFENVCRHLPLSLDYGNGEFFTADGRHLVCQTHGALYEPVSGRCVDGPCRGARLKPVPIRIVDEKIWLDLPAPKD